MRNLRDLSGRTWAAYLVLGLALGDGAAIYYAHNRLSTPWTEQPGFQDGDVTPIVEAPRAIVKDVWPAAPALAVQVVPAREPAMSRSLPVPEFSPLKLAFAEEDPVTEMPLAVRIPERSTLRVARLQQSRTAARRFEAAFATDIAGPAGKAPVDAPSQLAAPPAQPGETTQTGAAGGYAEIYAQLAKDSASAGDAIAEVPAQDSAELAAPQVETQPAAELPPVEADAASENPPG